MSDDGMYLYYIGIIDYLQDFNWNKKGENFLKGFRDDPNEISAVPPEQYAVRFFKFMQKTVIKNQLIPSELSEQKLESRDIYIQERRKSSKKR